MEEKEKNKNGVLLAVSITLFCLLIATTLGFVYYIHVLKDEMNANSTVNNNTITNNVVENTTNNEVDTSSNLVVDVTGKEGNYKKIDDELFDYEDVVSSDEKYVVSSTAYTEDDYIYTIRDNKTKEIVKSYLFKGKGCGAYQFTSHVVGGKTVYHLSFIVYREVSGDVAVILDENLKVFYNNSCDALFNYSNDAIMIACTNEREQKFVVYNSSGDNIYTSKEYDQIGGIALGYAVVRDNDKFGLVDSKGTFTEIAPTGLEYGDSIAFGEEGASLVQTDSKGNLIIYTATGAQTGEEYHKITYDVKNKKILSTVKTDNYFE